MHGKTYFINTLIAYYKVFTLWYKTLESPVAVIWRFRNKTELKKFQLNWILSLYQH